MYVDLSALRIGSKVKLRGSKGVEPRKPWPRGWKEIADIEPYSTLLPVTAIRVVGDERWLPVELIEEIADADPA